MSRMDKQREALNKRLSELKEAGIFLKVKQNLPTVRLPWTGQKTRYGTMAYLYRVKDNGHKEPLVCTMAECGPRDTPSRKMGWNIAVGRAIAQYDKKYGNTLGPIAAASRRPRIVDIVAEGEAA